MMRYIACESGSMSRASRVGGYSGTCLIPPEQIPQQLSRASWLVRESPTTREKVMAFKSDLGLL